MQHVSPIEDFPTEKFELLIQIMQIAPFIAIKHAFPIMKQQNMVVLLMSLLLTALSDLLEKSPTIVQNMA